MTLINILSDASRPQQETIAAFTSPVSKAVKTADSSKVEEALSETWRDLIEVAKKTPHSEQEHLATITKKVQRQAGPSTDDGQSCNVWDEPVSWDRMSLLGPALRDSWNWSSEDKNASASAEEWVNLNAFVARITAGYRPSEPFDFSLYGLWSLRTALENQDPKEAVSHDADIQAAAVWMLYASQVLIEKSQSRFEYDGKMAREGDSLRGKEWKGCSMERWQIWEERFKVFQEKSADKVTKDLVQSALAQMKKAAPE